MIKTDNNVIDFNAHINKRNIINNTAKYESDIIDSYADEIADEFNNMLKEVTKPETKKTKGESKYE